jgi:hypothetical protein
MRNLLLITAYCGMYQVDMDLAARLPKTGHQPIRESTVQHMDTLILLWASDAHC